MNDESIQRYAKAAGVLLLITTVAGGFGEAYVPSAFFISNDPAGTAANLQHSEFLFRLGFASYLVEAMCDIALSLVFYVLLKPVNRNIALLSAFFGLVSTAVFASHQLYNFATLHFVSDTQYLNSFSREQLNTLMLISVKYYALGSGVFMVFYGVAATLKGYLIYYSGFLPKFLGAFLVIAGLSFITRNFLLVLAPQYASSYFLLPMILAVIPLTIWLLVKGVAIDKWQQATKTLKSTYSNEL